MTTKYHTSARKTKIELTNEDDESFTPTRRDFISKPAIAVIHLTLPTNPVTKIYPAYQLTNAPLALPFDEKRTISYTPERTFEETEKHNLMPLKVNTLIIEEDQNEEDYPTDEIDVKNLHSESESESMPPFLMTTETTKATSVKMIGYNTTHADDLIDKLAVNMAVYEESENGTSPISDELGMVATIPLDDLEISQLSDLSDLPSTINKSILSTSSTCCSVVVIPKAVPLTSIPIYSSHLLPDLFTFQNARISTATPSRITSKLTPKLNTTGQLLPVRHIITELFPNWTWLAKYIGSPTDLNFNIDNVILPATPKLLENTPFLFAPDIKRLHSVRQIQDLDGLNSIKLLTLSETTPFTTIKPNFAKFTKIIRKSKRNNPVPSINLWANPRFPESHFLPQYKNNYTLLTNLLRYLTLIQKQKLPLLQKQLLPLKNIRRPSVSLTAEGGGYRLFNNPPIPFTLEQEQQLPSQRIEHVPDNLTQQTDNLAPFENIPRYLVSIPSDILRQTSTSSTLMQRPLLSDNVKTLSNTATQQKFYPLLTILPHSTIQRAPLLLRSSSQKEGSYPLFVNPPVDLASIQKQLMVLENAEIPSDTRMYQKKYPLLVRLPDYSVSKIPLLIRTSEHLSGTSTQQKETHPSFDNLPIFPIGIQLPTQNIETLSNPITQKNNYPSFTISPSYSTSDLEKPLGISTQQTEISPVLSFEQQIPSEDIKNLADDVLQHKPKYASFTNLPGYSTSVLETPLLFETNKYPLGTSSQQEESYLSPESSPTFTTSVQGHQLPTECIEIASKNVKEQKSYPSFKHLPSHSESASERPLLLQSSKYPLETSQQQKGSHPSSTILPMSSSSVYQQQMSHKDADIFSDTVADKEKTYHSSTNLPSSSTSVSESNKYSFDTLTQQKETHSSYENLLTSIASVYLQQLLTKIVGISSDIATNKEKGYSSFTNRPNYSTPVSKTPLLLQSSKHLLNTLTEQKATHPSFGNLLISPSSLLQRQMPHKDVSSTLPFIAELIPVQEENNTLATPTKNHKPSTKTECKSSLNTTGITKPLVLTGNLPLLQTNMTLSAKFSTLKTTAACQHTKQTSSLTDTEDTTLLKSLIESVSRIIELIPKETYVLHSTKTPTSTCYSAKPVVVSSAVACPFTKSQSSNSTISKSSTTPLSSHSTVLSTSSRLRSRLLNLSKLISALASKHTKAEHHTESTPKKNHIPCSPNKTASKSKRSIRLPTNFKPSKDSHEESPSRATPDLLKITSNSKKSSRFFKLFEPTLSLVQDIHNRENNAFFISNKIVTQPHEITRLPSGIHSANNVFKSHEAIPSLTLDALAKIMQYNRDTSKSPKIQSINILPFMTNGFEAFENLPVKTIPISEPNISGTKSYSFSHMQKSNVQILPPILDLDNAFLIIPLHHNHTDMFSVKTTTATDVPIALALDQCSQSPLHETNLSKFLVDFHHVLPTLQATLELGQISNQHPYEKISSTPVLAEILKNKTIQMFLKQPSISTEAVTIISPASISQQQAPCTTHPEKPLTAPITNEVTQKSFSNESVRFLLILPKRFLNNSLLSTINNTNNQFPRPFVNTLLLQKLPPGEALKARFLRSPSSTQASIISPPTKFISTMSPIKSLEKKHYNNTCQHITESVTSTSITHTPNLFAAEMPLSISIESNDKLDSQLKLLDLNRHKNLMKEMVSMEIVENTSSRTPLNTNSSHPRQKIEIMLSVNNSTNLSPALNMLQDTSPISEQSLISITKSSTSAYQPQRMAVLQTPFFLNMFTVEKAEELTEPPSKHFLSTRIPLLRYKGNVNGNVYKLQSIKPITSAYQTSPSTLPLLDIPSLKPFTFTSAYQTRPSTVRLLDIPFFLNMLTAENTKNLSESAQSSCKQNMEITSETCNSLKEESNTSDLSSQLKCLKKIKIILLVSNLTTSPSPISHSPVQILTNREKIILPNSNLTTELAAVKTTKPLLTQSVFRKNTKASPSNNVFTHALPVEMALSFAKFSKLTAITTTEPFAPQQTFKKKIAATSQTEVAPVEEALSFAKFSKMAAISTVGTLLTQQASEHSVTKVSSMNPDTSTITPLIIQHSTIMRPPIASLLKKKFKTSTMENMRSWMTSSKRTLLSKIKTILPKTKTSLRRYIYPSQRFYRPSQPLIFEIEPAIPRAFLQTRPVPEMVKILFTSNTPLTTKFPITSKLTESLISKIPSLALHQTDNNIYQSNITSPTEISPENLVQNKLKQVKDQVTEQIIQKTTAVPSENQFSKMSVMQTPTDDFNESPSIKYIILKREIVSPELQSERLVPLEYTTLHPPVTFELLIEKPSTKPMNINYGLSNKQGPIKISLPLDFGFISPDKSIPEIVPVLVQQKINIPIPSLNQLVQSSTVQHFNLKSSEYQQTTNIPMKIIFTSMLPQTYNTNTNSFTTTSTLTTSSAIPVNYKKTVKSAERNQQYQRLHEALALFPVVNASLKNISNSETSTNASIIDKELTTIPVYTLKINSSSVGTLKSALDQTTTVASSVYGHSYTSNKISIEGVTPKSYSLLPVHQQLNATPFYISVTNASKRQTVFDEQVTTTPVYTPAIDAVAVTPSTSTLNKVPTSAPIIGVQFIAIPIDSLSVNQSLVTPSSNISRQKPTNVSESVFHIHPTTFSKVLSVINSMIVPFSYETSTESTSKTVISLPTYQQLHKLPVYDVVANTSSAVPLTNAVNQTTTMASTMNSYTPTNTFTKTSSVGTTIIFHKEIFAENNNKTTTMKKSELLPAHLQLIKVPIYNLILNTTSVVSSTNTTRQSPAMTLPRISRSPRNKPIETSTKETLPQSSKVMVAFQLFKTPTEGFNEGSELLATGLLPIDVQEHHPLPTNRSSLTLSSQTAPTITSAQVTHLHLSRNASLQKNVSSEHYLTSLVDITSENPYNALKTGVHSTHINLTPLIEIPFEKPCIVSKTCKHSITTIVDNDSNPFPFLSDIATEITTTAKPKPKNMFELLSVLDALQSSATVHSETKAAETFGMEAEMTSLNYNSPTSKRENRQIQKESEKYLLLRKLMTLNQNFFAKKVTQKEPIYQKTIAEKNFVIPFLITFSDSVTAISSTANITESSIPSPGSTVLPFKVTQIPVPLYDLNVVRGLPYEYDLTVTLKPSKDTFLESSLYPSNNKSPRKKKESPDNNLNNSKSMELIIKRIPLAELISSTFPNKDDMVSLKFMETQPLLPSLNLPDHYIKNKTSTEQIFTNNQQFPTVISQLSRSILNVSFSTTPKELNLKGSTRPVKLFYRNANVTSTPNNLNDDKEDFLALFFNLSEPIEKNLTSKLKSMQVTRNPLHMSNVHGHHQKQNLSMFAIQNNLKSFFGIIQELIHNSSNIHQNQVTLHNMNLTMYPKTAQFKTISENTNSIPFMTSIKTTDKILNPPNTENEQKEQSSQIFFSLNTEKNNNADKKSTETNLPIKESTERNIESYQKEQFLDQALKGFLSSLYKQLQDNTSMLHLNSDLVFTKLNECLTAPHTTKSPRNQSGILYSLSTTMNLPVKQQVSNKSTTNVINDYQADQERHRFLSCINKLTENAYTNTFYTQDSLLLYLEMKLITCLQAMLNRFQFSTIDYQNQQHSENNLDMGISDYTTPSYNNTYFATSTIDIQIPSFIDLQTRDIPSLNETLKSFFGANQQFKKNDTIIQQNDNNSNVRGYIENPIMLESPFKILSKVSSSTPNPLNPQVNKNTLNLPKEKLNLELRRLFKVLEGWSNTPSHNKITSKISEHTTEGFQGSLSKYTFSDLKETKGDNIQISALLKLAVGLTGNTITQTETYNLDNIKYPIPLENQSITLSQLTNSTPSMVGLPAPKTVLKHPKEDLNYLENTMNFTPFKSQYKNMSAVTDSIPNLIELQAHKETLNPYKENLNMELQLTKLLKILDAFNLSRPSNNIASTVKEQTTEQLKESSLIYTFSDLKTPVSEIILKVASLPSSKTVSNMEDNLDKSINQQNRSTILYEDKHTKPNLMLIQTKTLNMAFTESTVVTEKNKPLLKQMVKSFFGFHKQTNENNANKKHTKANLDIRKTTSTQPKRLSTKSNQKSTARTVKRKFLSSLNKHSKMNKISTQYDKSNLNVTDRIEHFTTVQNDSEITSEDAETNQKSANPSMKNKFRSQYSENSVNVTNRKPNQSDQNSHQTQTIKYNTANSLLIDERIRTFERKTSEITHKHRISTRTKNINYSDQYPHMVKVIQQMTNNDLELILSVLNACQENKHICARFAGDCTVRNMPILSVTKQNYLAALLKSLTENLQKDFTRLVNNPFHENDMETKDNYLEAQDSNTENSVTSHRLSHKMLNEGVNYYHAIDNIPSSIQEIKTLVIKQIDNLKAPKLKKEAMNNELKLFPGHKQSSLWSVHNKTAKKPYQKSSMDSQIPKPIEYSEVKEELKHFVDHRKALFSKIYSESETEEMQPTTVMMLSGIQTTQSGSRDSSTVKAKNFTAKNTVTEQASVLPVTINQPILPLTTSKSSMLYTENISSTGKSRNLFFLNSPTREKQEISTDEIQTHYLNYRKDLNEKLEKLFTVLETWCRTYEHNQIISKIKKDAIGKLSGEENVNVKLMRLINILNTWCAVSHEYIRKGLKRTMYTLPDYNNVYTDFTPGITNLQANTKTLYRLSVKGTEDQQSVAQVTSQTDNLFFGINKKPRKISSISTVTKDNITTNKAVNKSSTRSSRKPHKHHSKHTKGNIIKGTTSNLQDHIQSKKTTVRISSTSSFNASHKPSLKEKFKLIIGGKKQSKTKSTRMQQTETNAITTEKTCDPNLNSCSKDISTTSDMISTQANTTILNLQSTKNSQMSVDQTTKKHSKLKSKENSTSTHHTETSLPSSTESMLTTVQNQTEIALDDRKCTSRFTSTQTTKKVLDQVHAKDFRKSVSEATRQNCKFDESVGACVRESNLNDNLATETSKETASQTTRNSKFVPIVNKKINKNDTSTQSTETAFQIAEKTEYFITESYKESEAQTTKKHSKFMPILNKKLKNNNTNTQSTESNLDITESTKYLTTKNNQDSVDEIALQTTKKHFKFMPILNKKLKNNNTNTQSTESNLDITESTKYLTTKNNQDSVDEIALQTTKKHSKFMPILNKKLKNNNTIMQSTESNLDITESTKYLTTKNNQDSVDEIALQTTKKHSKFMPILNKKLKNNDTNTQSTESNLDITESTKYLTTKNNQDSVDEIALQTTKKNSKFLPIVNKNINKNNTSTYSTENNLHITRSTQQMFFTTEDYPQSVNLTTLKKSKFHPILNKKLEKNNTNTQSTKNYLDITESTKYLTMENNQDFVDLPTTTKLSLHSSTIKELQGNNTYLTTESYKESDFESTKENLKFSSLITKLKKNNTSTHATKTYHTIKSLEEPAAHTTKKHFKFLSFFNKKLKNKTSTHSTTTNLHSTENTGHMTTSNYQEFAAQPTKSNITYQTEANTHSTENYTVTLNQYEQIAEVIDQMAKNDLDLLSKLDAIQTSENWQFATGNYIDKHASETISNCSYAPGNSIDEILDENMENTTLPESILKLSTTTHYTTTRQTNNSISPNYIMKCYLSQCKPNVTNLDKEMQQLQQIQFLNNDINSLIDPYGTKQYNSSALLKALAESVQKDFIRRIKIRSDNQNEMESKDSYLEALDPYSVNSIISHKRSPRMVNKDVNYYDVFDNIPYATQDEYYVTETATITQPNILESPMLKNELVRNIGQRCNEEKELELICNETIPTHQQTVTLPYPKISKLSNHSSMKSQIAKPVEDVGDEELKHFSDHSKSTLCEICNETETLHGTETTVVKVVNGLETTKSEQTSSTTLTTKNILIRETTKVMENRIMKKPFIVRPVTINQHALSASNSPATSFLRRHTTVEENKIKMNSIKDLSSILLKTMSQALLPMTTSKSTSLHTEKIPQTAKFKDLQSPTTKKHRTFTKEIQRRNKTTPNIKLTKLLNILDTWCNKTEKLSDKKNSSVELLKILSIVESWCNTSHDEIKSKIKEDATETSQRSLSTHIHTDSKTSINEKNYITDLVDSILGRKNVSSQSGTSTITKNQDMTKTHITLPIHPVSSVPVGSTRATEKEISSKTSYSVHTTLSVHPLNSTIRRPTHKSSSIKPHVDILKTLPGYPLTYSLNLTTSASTRITENQNSPNTSFNIYTTFPAYLLNLTITTEKKMTPRTSFNTRTTHPVSSLDLSKTSFNTRTTQPDYSLNPSKTSFNTRTTHPVSSLDLSKTSFNTRTTQPDYSLNPSKTSFNTRTTHPVYSLNLSKTSFNTKTTHPVYSLNLTVHASTSTLKKNIPKTSVNIHTTHPAYALNLTVSANNSITTKKSSPESSSEIPAYTLSSITSFMLGTTKMKSGPNSSSFGIKATDSVYLLNSTSSTSISTIKKKINPKTSFGIHTTPFAYQFNLTPSSGVETIKKTSSPTSSILSTYPLYSKVSVISNTTKKGHSTKTPVSIHSTLHLLNSAPSTSTKKESKKETKTTFDIHINLPVYPLNSTATIESYEKYYSTSAIPTGPSQIVDDEATDYSINANAFRSMKYEDFLTITEFSPTHSFELYTPKVITSPISSKEVLHNKTMKVPSPSSTHQVYNMNGNQEATSSTHELHSSTTEDIDYEFELLYHPYKEFERTSTTTEKITFHHKNVNNKIKSIYKSMAPKHSALAALQDNVEDSHLNNTSEESSTNGELSSNTEVDHLQNTSEELSTHDELSSNTEISHSHDTSEEISTIGEIPSTTPAHLSSEPLKPVITNLPEIQLQSTCNLTDFQASNHCICSIDNLIKDLRIQFTNHPLDINMDNYTCPIFRRLEMGIIVGNDSIPQIMKIRRDISDYFVFVKKRDLIENKNVEKTLNEQFDLKNTENEMFATPGMKIEMPCFNTMKETFDKITKYEWTFSDNLPLTEGKVQESGGTLIIENLSPQDGGNYTCTVKVEDGEAKKFEHHLSIISLPTYTIIVHIFYNTTNKCEETDSDILFMYLPNVFGSFLCGDYFKACKVELKEPSCSEENHISVNMSVIIEPMNVIMPTLNTMMCDFNCQMRIYSRITAFIIKNLESLEKLPVFFRLSFRKQILYPIEKQPIKKQQQQIGTELPNLLIACPPGFGYHKRTHICGTCGRNTFSRGDETHCTACPAGQYQPTVGSKSCLKCTSPLQDPYCLRIVYSNVQQFNIAIGIAATLLIVIIILLVACRRSKNTSTNRNPYRTGRQEYLRCKRNFRRRSQDIDIEQQDTEPLLDNKHKSRKYKTNKMPPEPPPPDFF